MTFDPVKERSGILMISVWGVTCLDTCLYRVLCDEYGLNIMSCYVMSCDEYCQMIILCCVMNIAYLLCLFQFLHSTHLASKNAILMLCYVLYLWYLFGAILVSFHFTNSDLLVIVLLYYKIKLWHKGYTNSAMCLIL